MTPRPFRKWQLPRWIDHTVSYLYLRIVGSRCIGCGASLPWDEHLCEDCRRIDHSMDGCRGLPS